MSPATSKGACPFCKQDLDCEETVVLGDKGAEGVNHASIERGVEIKIEDGTHVHKTCQALTA